jgi:hypothetical protein
MQEKESFKVRRLKQEAEKRIKITTTLRQDLWEAIQVAAIKSKRNANDMLEESIVDILKEPTKRLAAENTRLRKTIAELKAEMKLRKGGK